MGLLDRALEIAAVRDETGIREATDHPGELRRVWRLVPTVARAIETVHEVKSE